MGRKMERAAPHKIRSITDSSKKEVRSDDGSLFFLNVLFRILPFQHTGTTGGGGALSGFFFRFKSVNSPQLMRTETAAIP